MLVMSENNNILTDSRYTEQVTIEAPEFGCIDIGKKGYSKTLKELVNSKVKTIGVSSDG